MARYNLVPAGFEDDDDDQSDDDCHIPDFGQNIGQSVKKTCRNMKITIVPDVIQHMGLNGPFDTLLDENSEQWLDRIKKLFNVYKRSPIVSDTIVGFFLSTTNPYRDSLKVLANCPKSDLSKNNSVAFKIMEELNKFKNQNPETAANHVDDNLKMVAFNLIKQHGHIPLRLIVNSFNLKESRHMFLANVRQLIEQHIYKEACQIAFELEMFDEFTIFDFLFPLVLQDKFNPIEEYLEKAVHLQKPFIDLLDSLLDRSNSVSANVSKFIDHYGYTDVRHSKLQSKTITKLITRLSKNFNIPLENTSNVNRIKNYGALQFLLHKNFVERTQSKDSWMEMVKETVPSNSLDLQIDLVYGCSDYQDYKEAHFWAKHFNVPADKYPMNLKEYVENLGRGENKPNNNRDEKAIQYEMHTLALDREKIIVIDSENKFNDMITDLRRQKMIAFDSEWKPPTFGMTASQVAVIQLATRQCVYIIDVVTLNLDTRDWNNLGKYVFNNDEILKLGFAPTTDLQMFQKSLPSLNLAAHSVHSSTSYLDLQEFSRKIKGIKNFRFPYQSDNNSENLSNLVKKCIGKKLDKSNQFSNWENRPLREAQILYAALDAFVLIELYDVLEIELPKLKINFNEFLDQYLIENKTKMPNKKKDRTQRDKNRQGKSNQLSSSLNSSNSDPVLSGPNENPVPIDDIRFVCDSMLGGLAKALRKCGISTVVLKDRDHHDECLRLVLKDSKTRYVLTRGEMYSYYSGYVNHCLKIKSDNVDEQLLEVLTYYKIVIRRENVFSRCQVCNSNSFIEATQWDMCKMVGKADNPLSTCSTPAPSFQSKRSWNLKKMSANILYSGKTSYGAKIQLQNVSDSVIMENEVFYLCEGCGKVYWDGSHYSRALKGPLKNILMLKYL